MIKKEKNTKTNIVQSFIDLTKLTPTKAGAAMDVCYVTVANYLHDDSRVKYETIINMLSFLNKKNISAALEYNSKSNKLELKKA